MRRTYRNAVWQAGFSVVAEEVQNRGYRHQVEGRCHSLRRLMGKRARTPGSHL